MSWGVTLLLVISFCIYDGVIAAEFTRDYGIMIDAGSSGSRIILYDWPHNSPPNSIPLVQPSLINQEVISLKNSNPISSYAENSTSAGSSLLPLLDYIKQKLPKERWESTPLFLFSTSSMRSLSSSSQNAILGSVRSVLLASPFDFEDDQAKVISGTEEGIYGWITANFATNTLQTSSANTFGALDMGGANSYITFVPTNTPTSNAHKIEIGANSYTLYSYSYPLGQDVSLTHLLNGLIADNITDDLGNVANPCYHTGWNEVYLDRNVIGTSNYDDCVSAISKYITKKDPACTECGLGSIYQPALTGSFYAFSAYAYTNAFLGLSNTATIKELQDATSQFCDKDWTTIRSQYNSTSYLKSYCFTGAYFQQALLDLGFSATGTNLITQSSIDNMELSWTLGAMVYEASKLPIDKPIDGISAGSITGPQLSILLIIVAIVALFQ